MNMKTNKKLLVVAAPNQNYYGIYLTPNKNETIRQLLERCVVFNSPAKYPIIDFEIKMPCGETVFYKTLDDIPTVDTPCACGNREHYFVKIREPITETIATGGQVI